MIRYYILNPGALSMNYLGVGETARTRYEAWRTDPANSHRIIRDHTSVGDVSYSLEFDGAIDERVMITGDIAMPPAWVVRRRVRTPLNAGERGPVIVRRQSLGAARVAFMHHVGMEEREQRRAGVTAPQPLDAAAQRIEVEAARFTARFQERAQQALTPQQPAAEITTDLIGTPIHPQGAVPVFDDERERDEDI